MTSAHSSPFPREWFCWIKFLSLFITSPWGLWCEGCTWNHSIFPSDKFYVPLCYWKIALGSKKDSFKTKSTTFPGQTENRVLATASPEVTTRVPFTHSEMKPVSKEEKMCPYGPFLPWAFFDRTKTASWTKIAVL